VLAKSMTLVRGNGQNILVFRIPLDCANRVLWTSRRNAEQNVSAAKTETAIVREDPTMKTQETSLTEHRQ
jgi:hypothetical protein